MTLVHMLVAVVGEQRDQGTWRRGSLREEARGSSMVLIGRADWRPRGALPCLGTRSVARDNGRAGAAVMLVEGTVRWSSTAAWWRTVSRRENVARGGCLGLLCAMFEGKCGSKWVDRRQDGKTTGAVGWFYNKRHRRRFLSRAVRLLPFATLSATSRCLRAGARTCAHDG
jgi:hypothetical protein